jgi:hypothetical protein
MWQERVNREGRVSAPRGSVTAVGPVNAPGVSAPTAVGEFSLDFSAVRIPPGRYLTDSEVNAAVHSFLDELETA